MSGREQSSIEELRETIETVTPGAEVAFNDVGSAENPYRVIAVEEREGLPMTLDQREPRPWTKTLKLVGPGADRRDEPRWKIRFAAGTERTEPTCKLRYRRRDSDEIDMGGQWTGHGDVEQLAVIEETEEPERDAETGVYLEPLEECPDCGNRTDTRTEYGRVDPEEIGISSRYIVFALRCKECDREWRESRMKEYEESLAEFEA